MNIVKKNKASLYMIGVVLGVITELGLVEKTINAQTTVIMLLGLFFIALIGVIIYALVKKIKEFGIHRLPIGDQKF